MMNDVVGIAEEGDELGYGVVGHHGRQQFRLVCPSESELVVSHLHPDAVNLVGRHNMNVGNHEMVTLGQAQRVGRHPHQRLLGQLLQQA